jgi:hypothetical protein
MKKTTPALLDNRDTPKYYLIKIRNNLKDTTEIKFSNREAANIQYNQIRSAGIWSGSWIETIELTEHAIN